MNSSELLRIGDKGLHQREDDIMSSASGSDSDPTQDNLEDNEFQKLIPETCRKIDSSPGRRESQKQLNSANTTF